MGSTRLITRQRMLRRILKHHFKVEELGSAALRPWVTLNCCFIEKICLLLSLDALTFWETWGGNEQWTLFGPFSSGTDKKRQRHYTLYFCPLNQLAEQAEIMAFQVETNDKREAERRGPASTHVEGCHLCEWDDKGVANSCYRVNLEDENKEEEGRRVFKAWISHLINSSLLRGKGSWNSFRLRRNFTDRVCQSVLRVIQHNSHFLCANKEYT